MKTKLNYTVRTTRAPGEARDSIVPVIVERLSPVELATVVENCIDRGLIAGLKPTAARGIAEGVASQIAREFSLGRGVQFGRYFYGRPYLSGTVDANGRLTSGNRVNVRLYKGDDFKLTLDDFALTFDGAGDAVKIESVFGDTSGAGGNKHGQIVSGAPVMLNGRNLYAAGDTNRVKFTESGGSATVVVEVFATQSADMLTFAWPTGLVAGKAYTVVVERTDVNGRVRESAPKTVAVVAGATPPAEPPTITLVHGEDDDDVNLGGCDVYVVGEHLDGATAVEYCETADGEAFYTMDAAYDPETGRLSGHADFVGSSPQRGFARVTTPGGTATHAVEFSNH